MVRRQAPPLLDPDIIEDDYTYLLPGTYLN